MSDTILWYATRGAGVVTLILFSGVVVLGIVSSMRWQTPAWPRFLTTGFHRNLALTTLAFLALHIVTAVVDPFTALGWNASLIPFSSSYRRLVVGARRAGPVPTLPPRVHDSQVAVVVCLFFRAAPRLAPVVLAVAPGPLGGQRARHV